MDSLLALAVCRIQPRVAVEDGEMRPNKETWQKLAVLVLSVPLAIYLISQGGSDPRWGLLFIVVPVIMVVGFLVMFVVHLVRERDER